VQADEKLTAFVELESVISCGRATGFKALKNLVRGEQQQAKSALGQSNNSLERGVRS
jgi:hypothetical protein